MTKNSKPKEFKSKDGKVIAYAPFKVPADFTKLVFVPSGQGRSSVEQSPLFQNKLPKE